MYLIRPFYGKESQSIFILEDPHTINFNYQLGRGILLKPFYTLYIPTYLPFKNTFLDIYIIILLQMEMLAPFHPYFLDFMEWKDTSSASF